MKKYLLLLCVISVILVSQGTAQTFFPEVPRIDVTMAYYKYKAGNAIFINAMPPETFAKKHVLGSFNFPNNGPEDRERIANMRIPFPKDKEILVYCG